MAVYDPHLVAYSIETVSQSQWKELHTLSALLISCDGRVEVEDENGNTLIHNGFPAISLSDGVYLNFFKFRPLDSDASIYYLTDRRGAKRHS